MTTYGTLNQMRYFITDLDWKNSGATHYPLFFDISANGSNGVIKYNVTGFNLDRVNSDPNGLTEPRANLVRDAFKYLENVTGIDFQETKNKSGYGTIYFKDTVVDAAETETEPGKNTGEIIYSVINISKDWYDSSNLSNDYITQSILHEIGHALGLGHQGPYDIGNGDPVFTNDNWQNSIMSYVSQTDNTAINASYAFLQSMMSVDFLALDELYGKQSYSGHSFGSSQAFTGNTIYGFHTNISTAADPYLSRLAINGDENAYTIADGGGNDTFDFSGWSKNQIIDLRPSDANAKRPSISNIGGLTGNLTLAVGTIIENAIGGAGNDKLYGNSASNALKGNGGNDTLYGYDGNDRLYGGDGNDSTVGGNGKDVIYGQNGDDKLYGQNDNDTLYGQVGDDKLYGQAGDDVLNGGAGSDTLDGGPGIDTAIYIHSRAGVNANLSNGKASSSDTNSDTYGEGNSDALKNIENLTGSKYNDTFVGDAGNNTLSGGDGKDTLYGQAGDDVLNGGAGVDTLNGGSGNDTATYIHSRAGVNANLSNGKASSSDTNSDTYGEGNSNSLKSIENLTGSKYNDTFVGDAGNNILRGGGGNDALYGQSGDDGLYGDAGNDTLSGQGGNDVIKGGVGSDTIEGGSGRDFMYAGNDNNRDIFVFRGISESGLASTARDSIYEFDSGEDDIDLSAIDANTRAGGNQAFTFSTTGAAANAVWAVDTGADLVIYGDVNGNTTADFSIRVVGINTLLASDFIL